MGPLHGVKVVEIASIGPGPFAVMMLADMGADVIRLERSDGGGGLGSGSWNFMHRGSSVGRMRPQVADRHGSSRCGSARRPTCSSRGSGRGSWSGSGSVPTTSRRATRELVYGRMTGYGQEGPMAAVAGHDINYISLSGALGAIAAGGRAAAVPAQPRRRLRRRRHAAGARGPRRGDRGARVRPRPGRRRVDGRGRLGDDDLDPRDAGDRHVDGAARHQPARLRRPLLRGLRVLGRRPHRRRRARAAVLRARCSS